MRLKTFKHLALVTAVATVLAACGGGNGSDPMAAASQVSDSQLSWVEQPASIKFDGADAASSAALKERRTRSGATAAAADGSEADGNTGNSERDNSAGETDSSNSDGSNSNTDSSNTDGGNSADGTDGSGTGNGDTAGDDTDSTDVTPPSFAAGDSSVPAGAAPGSYGAMTFDEEWNGSLDTSKWSTRMPHWGDAPELDNWTIEDGKLKIWTPKQDNGKFLFENRAMVTHEKFNQLYGWFEMEAKLPPGQGMWPSFWLYGIYGTDRPEIDIMESHGGVDEWWGDPNPIDYGATVWLGQLDGNHERVGMVRPTHYGITPGDLTTGFHKYGALWEPDGITFFFDGQQFGDKIYTSRMNRELWIIIGLGTGVPGTYNAPTSRTPTDSRFEINYVRAWALPGGVTTVNGRKVD